MTPEFNSDLASSSNKIPSIIDRDFVEAKFADRAISRNKIDSTARFMPAFDVVRTVTETGSISILDGCILVNATSGTITLTLPSAASLGSFIHIKRTDNSVNVVTITASGTDTIEGSTTYSGLNAQWKSVTLYSTGSAWCKFCTT